MSRSVYGSIYEWISKLREGEPFEIKFSKIIGGMTSMGKTDNLTDTATITPCTQANKQSRLQSGMEILRKHGNLKRKNTSIPVCDVDYEPTLLNFDNAVAHGINLSKDDYFNIICCLERKTYGCYLYGQSGHGRYDCTLLKRYAIERGVILRKNMQTERDNLLQFITNTSGGNCFKRSDAEKRVVYYELPTKVKALVLHKKYVVHKDAVLLLHISNLCVKCTLLGVRGISTNLYVKALFPSGCVGRYMAKASSSLILNDME